MFKSFTLLLISLYQRVVSPLLPQACRFYPTCSEYSRVSIIRYGMLKGSYLTLLRLGKCHPFHPGGFDPVPESIRITRSN